MSKIAIAMFPEEGHLIASFKLSRTLQGNGHQVTYVGLPDFESYVRQQGFDFLPILKESFPVGSRQRQLDALASKNPFVLLKEMSQSRFFTELCRAGREDSGEIRGLIDQCKPDLFIVDVFLSPLTLRARSMGIPVIMLSINLNLPRADDYPPITTSILPEGTPVSRLRAALAWRALDVVHRSGSLIGGFPWLKVVKETQQIAVACGHSPERVISTALFPQLHPDDDLPELVLCPPDFEFDRKTRPQSAFHFVEASVDLQRKAAPFAWQAIDNNKPLIFCTLGTQTHLYPKAQVFFQAVIDAVGERPDWQLVLAVGPHVDPGMFRHIASNALVVRWAPHTEILKRASLMINHAGLGTIKECIFFDVPMLVFPITRDQPGYAARVAHHRLGLMGNLRTATKRRIAAMIENIMNDPSFKLNVQRMGTKFRRMEESGEAVRFIEARLAAR